MTDGLQQGNESFYLDQCTGEQIQIGILPLDYMKTQAQQIHAHLAIADSDSLLSPLCSAFLFIDDGLLVSKEEGVQQFWNTLALYLVECKFYTIIFFLFDVLFSIGNTKKAGIADRRIGPFENF